MALLELFATAAGARVVAPNILQGIAYRLLGTMLAVRTVDVVMMIVVVLAVRAVNVGLVHVVFSGDRDPVIIDTARQKRSPRQGNIDVPPHCPDIF